MAEAAKFIDHLATLVAIPWQAAFGLAMWQQFFWAILGQRPDWLGRSWRFCGRAHQALLPIALPALTFRVVLSDSAYETVTGCVLIVIGWACRNWPDDEHWKRTRRKVVEKVQAVGARLVVVRA